MRDFAVIFDLDGTLLDTLEDLADATNYVMKSFGFPERTLEEVRRFVGNGAKNLISQAIPPETGAERSEEAFRAFQTHYRAHCRVKTRPYDGIAAALGVLAEEGYPMAIVSNKPDGAVKPLCGEYFPGIYARGESAECPRKPAPDMVLRAAEALGVKTDHCVYVGDSEVDVATARNAGMRCISVTWGFRNREELIPAGAERFCDNPPELLEIVREMEKQIHGK